MSTSRNLLPEFFECLEHLEVSIERAVDLFAVDGVLELPFSAVLGIPTRFQGKAEVRSAFAMLTEHFPGFALSSIDVQEVKGADEVFARYSSFGFIDGTDEIYTQDYVAQPMAEGGKIKLLRQYSVAPCPRCGDVPAAAARRRAGRSSSAGRLAIAEIRPLRQPLGSVRRVHCPAARSRQRRQHPMAAPLRSSGARALRSSSNRCQVRRRRCRCIGQNRDRREAGQSQSLNAVNV